VMSDPSTPISSNLLLQVFGQIGQLLKSVSSDSSSMNQVPLSVCVEYQYRAKYVEHTGIVRSWMPLH
jgi:hypothetical protein